MKEKNRQHRMMSSSGSGMMSERVSRRTFVERMGASARDCSSHRMPIRNLVACGGEETYAYLAKVAITQADSYQRALIKAKVQHLFDSIGGISDVVKAGSTVAIKINLTGSSSNASDARLKGVPITECM